MFGTNFMNSRLNVQSKSSILVWNYRDGVNALWSNRWHHLLYWCYAFSARDVRRTVLTAAFFCADFLRLTALNTIWAHFLGTKARIHPILFIPPKHAKRDKIDAKWLEKKFVFWRESRWVDEKVEAYFNYCKKKQHKRNRKVGVSFFFFQCKIEFYFTHKHQNLYFHLWLSPLVKIRFLVFI